MVIRIPKLPRSKPGAPSPIPAGYRPWMVLSLVVLVGSLFGLVVSAGIAFIYYANALTPLWLMVLGGLSAMGVLVGFGGFFLMLVVAGYRSFRE